jgi:hypothetical protein
MAIPLLQVLSHQLSRTVLERSHLPAVVLNAGCGC